MQADTAGRAAQPLECRFGFSDRAQERPARLRDNVLQALAVLAGLAAGIVIGLVLSGGEAGGAVIGTPLGPAGGQLVRAPCFRH